ncbi:MAG: DUF2889 domain-containing protein, partial [Minwuia sp.]|nr:DUF2889 domain-containing protein [Minwuia sp.]
ARERVGGTAGCTHIVELLPQMATATMQTIWPIKNMGGKKADGRPGILNTCHAWADYSPVVKERFPDYYVAPRPGTIDA